MSRTKAKRTHDPESGDGVRRRGGSLGARRGERGGTAGSSVGVVARGRGPRSVARVPGGQSHIEELLNQLDKPGYYGQSGSAMRTGLRSPIAPRAVWAAWVFFQAAALAVVPLAHAAMDARASAAVSHVESPTERPCVLGHDEFTCQLCRTTVIHGPSPVLWLAAALTAETPAPALVSIHESQSALVLPDSRAPPVLL